MKENEGHYCGNEEKRKPRGLLELDFSIGVKIVVSRHSQSIEIEIGNQSIQSISIDLYKQNIMICSVEWIET